MILLTAYCHIQPNAREVFLAVSRQNKATAHSEPGCLRFDFFESADEPDRFVFVEEWATQADLEAHFAQPAFQEFFAAISPCLAAPPEIRIFEAALQEGAN